MNTAEILKNIRSNGGFNNYHRWREKDVVKWVMANYMCSLYVAKKVAKFIM